MPTPFEAIAGIANACQAFPNVVTGGQPAVRHLEQLKASGAHLVLDLRDPMEPRPFDEPAVVKQLGMEYVNVPVTAGNLGDDQLDDIREILRRSASKQLFVHCASGSRVGGALLPYLMLDLKMEEEDAVGLATRVGMRSTELMEWGLEYSQRHAADP